MKIGFNDYQAAAHKTAAYGDRHLYPFLGLAEEAGEVIGKLAKAMRKNVDADHEDIKKELGDVLWMLSECCTVMDFDLEEVAMSNLEKLADRNERGVIIGEGDNR